MTSPGWVRVGGVATICALVGAGAGIAGSTAATSSTSSTKTGPATKPRTAPPARPARGPLGPGGPGIGFRGGPPVHEESVVLDEAGKKFITVTRDNGTVKSVSGDQLVITEGTKDVTYKDVTLTIPSGAKVVRNGKTAKLADLKEKDHVMVASSSDGTVVFAMDDSFRPMGGRGPGGPGGHGFGHHGPPPVPPAGGGTPGTYPGTP